jgi:HlyD family secretion protein/epimerase transport system membrane fusion protein
MNSPLNIDLAASSYRFEPSPVASKPPIDHLIVGALLAIGILFGAFGVWAAVAPLSSAALAAGVVKVETNRKTIQHAEGGIIRDIMVRDGDVVQKNKILLRLDSLDAETDRNAMRAQLNALVAQEARLIAERDNVQSVSFPQSLLAQSAIPGTQEILDGQRRIFLDHRQALNDQINVWVQRREQYRAQLAAMSAQIRSLEAQILLLEEQINDQKYLLAKGLSLKPKLLELQRQVVAAKGEIESSKGKSLALKGQMTETDVQIAGIRSTQAKSVSEELRDIQVKRADASEKLRKFEARAGRTEVVAPQDGTILNMRYFTIGGVVPPGGAIFDLVPSQDKMVFEVKVQPLDIDVVRPGLSAAVRLVAYKQRLTPVLEGTVSWVSADATIDDKINATYFLARIEVSATELRRVPHVKLYPGMPIDVSIATGERTLLAYIVQPLTDSFAKAFRED